MKESSIISLGGKKKSISKYWWLPWTARKDSI